MMNNTNTKRKKIIIISAAILLVLCLILLFFFLKRSNNIFGVPTLTVETPPKISVKNHEAFTVDITLSDMGDALYPAASLSLIFDSARLEFLGIEEGNIMILDDENADGSTVKLPDWSVDISRSNEIGQINVMYLDMTGGKYAFSKDLLAEGDHVLLRLSFRLRGSARAGDVYELEVADAVLAARDESESLAVTTDTLKTKNGKVVVGQ